MSDRPDILIPEKLARKIYNAADEMTFIYDGETPGGQSIYKCSFCGGFTYANSDHPLKHRDDCLGMEIIVTLGNTLP